MENKVLFNSVAVCLSVTKESYQFIGLFYFWSRILVVKPIVRLTNLRRAFSLYRSKASERTG